MDSPGSPWTRYLRAVYGQDVPLPFDLSQLSFFWHNSAKWQDAHPGLEWPMAACTSVPGFIPLNPSLFPTRSDSKCPRETCAAWLATPANPPRSKPIVSTKLYMRLLPMPEPKDVFEPASAVGNETEGIMFRMGQAYVASSGQLLEVIRRGIHDSAYLSHESCLCADHAARLDLKLQYGCYFFPTRGSGIYVNVTRTLAVTPKDKMSWARSFISSVLPDPESTLLRNTTRMHHAPDTLLAHAASLAGYGSIQLHLVSYHHGQLMSTTS